MAPDPVTDLRLGSVSGDDVAVLWTAPGDDGPNGAASQYEIRYSSNPIDAANWGAGIHLRGGPRPAAPGTTQGIHFTNRFSSDIYIALRAADEVPNWSALSNVLRVAGPSPEPPGLISVSAGTFEMGDGVADCGENLRSVRLTHPFGIGRYEVTNRQFVAALQWAYDNGYVTVNGSASAVIDNLGSMLRLVDLAGEDSEIRFLDGDFYLRDAGHGNDNGHHPVKEVSWYGAVAYCDWLSLSEGMAPAYDHGTWECNGGDVYGTRSYRLPTDAEWECAARFPDARIYPWGDDPPGPDRANYGNHVGWTTPVGSFPDGESRLGFQDMAGNVWEWCNDWHMCELGTLPVEDPVGPESGEYRVARGGSWDYFVGGHMRSAARYGYYRPWHTNGILGFRCARSL